MGIKEFFFPKDFKWEMGKGSLGFSQTVELGMKRVSEHKRGSFFFKFFAFLPLLGNLFFYFEGRKEERKLVGNKCNKSTSKKRKR